MPTILWVWTLNSLNQKQAERIAELEAVKTSKAEKPLNPRERESLLKLVIGLAKVAYRYDHKASRTTVTTEIANDLAKAGILLDADTVRKYLHEAKQHLPPETEV